MGKRTPGNVFGNVCQITPYQNAENYANRSIPSLQIALLPGIADGSIQHSSAKLTRGRIAGHCAAVHPLATITATIEAQSAALDEQIADYLRLLLPEGRPRRVARMLDYTPSGDKYRDIPRSKPFTRQMLLGHASGQSTWATALDAGGLASIGAIEVDAGGRSAVLMVLRAAGQLGLQAYAIAADNPLSGHAGGHVWFVYDRAYPVAGINAQLRAVASAAGLPENTEIWPRMQVIRLPFGYHRWAETRGELLLQSGEIISLDGDLSAGFAAVVDLPRNSAPPQVAFEASAPNGANPQRLRISPGKQAADRASLADVRERFNREHSLETLLAEYGATRAPGGYFCPCGVPHTHLTTLYISKLGRLFSYSQRCKLYSTKGYDAFGFYVKTQHNDDITAALKQLNPIGRSNSAPARDLPIGNSPEYVLSPEERARRAADAQRKRAAWAQQATAIRESISRQAEADDRLTPCDRSTLAAMLEWAAEHNAVSCWLGRASLARRAGYSLGSVKRSVMLLESYGYFESHGAGGRPIDTARRNFSRGSCFDERTILHANDDPRSIRTCDLDITLGACEGGATPQPDLALAAELDRELLSYVRALARELGTPAALLVDYAELDQATLLDQAARLEAQLAQVADSPIGETAIAGVDQAGLYPGELPDSGSIEPAAIAVTAPGGAWYDPAADWTAGGVLDLASWGISPVAHGQLLELDPLTPAPPLDSEPAYQAFIWRWHAAQPGAIDRRTGKPRSEKQRTRFAGEYQRYLVDVSPEEAAMRWAALDRPARRSSGQGAARAAPHKLKAFVQQATFI